MGDKGRTKKRSVTDASHSHLHICYDISQLIPIKERILTHQQKDFSMPKKTDVFTQIKREGGMASGVPGIESRRSSTDF